MIRNIRRGGADFIGKWAARDQAKFELQQFLVSNGDAVRGDQLFTASAHLPQAPSTKIFETFWTGDAKFKSVRLDALPGFPNFLILGPNSLVNPPGLDPYKAHPHRRPQRWMAPTWSGCTAMLWTTRVQLRGGLPTSRAPAAALRAHGTSMPVIHNNAIHAYTESSDVNRLHSTCT